MADSTDYLIYRISEKDKLLREAMEKLYYIDTFDAERADLARRIEEHMNEPKTRN